MRNYANSHSRQWVLWENLVLRTVTNLRLLRAGLYVCERAQTEAPRVCWLTWCHRSNAKLWYYYCGKSFFFFKCCPSWLWWDVWRGVVLWTRSHPSSVFWQELGVRHVSSSTPAVIAAPASAGEGYPVTTTPFYRLLLGFLGLVMPSLPSWELAAHRLVSHVSFPGLLISVGLLKTGLPSVSRGKGLWIVSSTVMVYRLCLLWEALKLKTVNVVSTGCFGCLLFVTFCRCVISDDLACIFSGVQLYGCCYRYLTLEFVFCCRPKSDSAHFC